MISATEAFGFGSLFSGSGLSASSLPSFTGQAAPKADEMTSPDEGTPLAFFMLRQTASFATLAERISRSAQLIGP